MPTIPDWTVSWANIGTTVGALLLLGGVVFMVWKAINPIAKKASRVMDLILGTPQEQGLPQQPSMIERIDQVSDKVTALDLANTLRLDQQNIQIAEIRSQVTPNHGSTSKLSEDIQTIAAGLAKLAQRFDDHMTRDQ
jgi:hypothetical protein